MELKLSLFKLILLLLLSGTCLGNNINFDNSSSNDTNTNNIILIKEFKKNNSEENVLKLWTIDKKIMLTDYLSDGELEKRIIWNGVIAKQTKTENELSNSLTLWQVSNGHGMVQIILTDDKWASCEIIRRKDIIDEFWEKFYHDVLKGKSKNLKKLHHKTRLPFISNHEFNQYMDNNIIPEDYYDLQNTLPIDEVLEMTDFEYKNLENLTEIPEELKEWLNYKQLKSTCRQRVRLTKQLAFEGKLDRINDVKEQAPIRAKRSFLDEILIAPNTRWCGRGHSASKYNDLGGSSRADRCCRTHDHCKVNIQGMATRWQLFNYRPYTISHCSCDISKEQHNNTHRIYKRDLSSFLRVPNTRWCGKGFSAKKYSELGGLSKADRCCRQHDYSCNLWIMGFETKYYLFNWRVNTLMHCRCDERFRTCLKMADTADANMVGKLFFNIVQTKCFVIKSEKVCKKRSKNGKCVKKVLRKRAHLRDNRKF